MNSFWKIFTSGIISIFKFSPNGKINIDNIDIEQYFKKSSEYINQAFENIRNDKTD